MTRSEISLDSEQAFVVRSTPTEQTFFSPQKVREHPMSASLASATVTTGRARALRPAPAAVLTAVQAGGAIRPGDLTGAEDARAEAARIGRHRVSPGTYWRRRAVTVLALVTVGLAGVQLLGGSGGRPLSASGPSHAPMTRVSSTVHIVEPGDTLWSIARELQPEGDVRQLVDDLVAQRDGRPLQVGERITLPA